MKNTFYVPEETAQFTFVVKKLALDLDEIVYGNVPENEVRAYVQQLVTQFTPLKGDEDMWFLQFDEPGNMPSDCRVEFVYMPTYYAASIMIVTLMRYPNVAKEISNYEDILSKVLMATTGRGFQGHGYEATDGFLETMEIFAKAKVAVFVRDFSHINAKFNKAFAKAVTFLDTKICTGKVKNPWSQEDYSEKGELISERIYLSLK